MIDNLANRTIIGITFVGIGLWIMAVVPSQAYVFEEVKEDFSSDLINNNELISNREYHSSTIKFTRRQNFFKKSPRLIDTTATHRNSNSNNATYYFTVEVPLNAGAALKSIKIQQREKLNEIIAFKPQENRAVMGKTFSGGKSLSLATIGGKETPGTVTVIFAQPVQPGETVTIGVRPKQNPSHDGTYLFGITAYPEGEDGQGLYLGVGRFHIRE